MFGSGGEVRHRQVELERRAGKRHLDLQAIAVWLGDENPSVIAIDAPSKRNCGLMAQPEVRQRHDFVEPGYDEFRVCEAMLRRRNVGVYNTPRDPSKVADWIELGWGLYENLCGKHGFSLWDQPGEVDLTNDQKWLIEVHPHASFVVGMGFVPQNKTTVAGMLERIAFLTKEAKRQSVCFQGSYWPTTGLISQFTQLVDDFGKHMAEWDYAQVLQHALQFPLLSHDLLDCLGGVVTALAALKGEAHAVGETNDGTIVLPSALSHEVYEGQAARRKRVLAENLVGPATPSTANRATGR